MLSVRAIRIQTLTWATLAILFLISAPLLWAASPLVLGMVAALGAGMGLATKRVLRAYRGKRRRSMLTGAAVACSLVAAPLYWLLLQPALHPLTVPRVTLSDGTRQVVFQGMIHIGSDQFYRSVVYDMLRARDAGYVLYFEGILPGTPEATAWLNAAVHADGDLNAQYARLANACGLEFQGDFLNFVQRQAAIDPAHVVLADVSVTEVYEEWKRLVAERPELDQPIAPSQAAGQDLTLSKGLDFVSRLGGHQRDFLAAACRGAFTLLLGRGEDADVMNLVVLDFRNRKLADRIAAAAGQDIYIAYGSGHLAGLLEEMRKRDPSWQILSTTWTTAILPPDDATGRLPVQAGLLMFQP
ncbi:hypothetical protein MLD63_16250 [Paracoccus sp. TK19116]|uniref:TraB/GumN family protein n=1 Tax=Paracoccus albicereus TaxID=2922394 RepID=A0ABT1MUI7_9RHOB|nr:hypothetical protein [Paracoccus albicereus]MCQ0971975.1 hypothetical protein [Paracoccus albicereus]